MLRVNHLTGFGRSGGGTAPVTPISLVAFTSALAGSTPGIDTTGATLIVVGTAYLAGTPGTLTDSNANTWIPLTEYASGAGNGRALMYYAENPIVGAAHVFTNGGMAFGSMQVAAFDTTAIASVFDKEAGAGSASATTQQPGSVTPDNPNSLLVTFLQWVGSSGDASINSGFTLTDSLNDASNFASALAYKVQTSATAENPTWTSPVAADRMTAAIAVFHHQ